MFKPTGRVGRVNGLSWKSQRVDLGEVNGLTFSTQRVDIPESTGRFSGGFAAVRQGHRPPPPRQRAKRRIGTGPISGQRRVGWQIAPKRFLLHAVTKYGIIPPSMEKIDLAMQKAAVLTEALPYIQDFCGSTVLVKVGGSVMENRRSRRAGSCRSSWRGCA